MDNITQISLDIATGEEIVVQKSKKIRHEKKPHFNMVGTGKMFNDKALLKAVDLLYEMTQMTKAESFAFITLRDNVVYISKDEGHQVHIPVRQTDMTDYQKKMFKIGINGLKEKDLVQRVQRAVYIINPMAIIPSIGFAEAEAIWIKNKE